MSTATFHIGDVFEVIETLGKDSVDLVVTSPPFLKVREYLPADHPDKAKEIGQEDTPAEFIDTLLRLVAALDRVLAPHGSMCFELGDTSSGSGGSGGDYSDTGMKAGQNKFTGTAAAKRKGREGLWPPDKSVCLIPEAFRLALAYGFNPLNGAESPAGRWIVRNVVRWVRTNPTPGADFDKFRRATSDIVVFTRNPKRWWDGDAVRVPASEKTNRRTAKGVDSKPNTTKYAAVGNYSTMATLGDCGDTAPLLDWWEISAAGYDGAHYAVYPPEVVVPLVKSMCPHEVCTQCGEPRRPKTDFACDCNTDPDTGDVHGDFYRRGVVLDPFGGSGTTGMVATGHGRDAVLIDLDERNADLAAERIGMFLRVVNKREAVA